MRLAQSWRAFLTIALTLVCAMTARSQSPLPAAEIDRAAYMTGMTAPADAPASDSVERKEHNILHRPIALEDGFRHWIARSYAYGSTQGQRRAVHLGVEFVNPRGTPVYAAKAGVVVFAGADSEKLLGPRRDYYGNVVVLAHDVYSLAGGQVFTLYAHLDSFEVEPGQALADLDRLGVVGASGVAIGPHLHFEVRVGDPFDYRATRNPELWLQHYVGHGLITGALRDEAGRHIPGKRVSIRSAEIKRDIFTYDGEPASPDPVWNENFSAGDLPAGEYELIVLSDTGAIGFAQIVLVEPYRVSYVDMALERAAPASDIRGTTATASR